jgi:hypothetical protein
MGRPGRAKAARGTLRPVAGRSRRGAGRPDHVRGGTPAGELHPAPGSSSRGPRLQALGTIFLPIIELTETKGWMVGRNTFVFYGLEPDVLMAEYLLHVVAQAVDHEEAAYRTSEAYRAGRATPQNRLRSFRYGFAERVSRRIADLAAHRRAAEEAARTPTASGTALVLVKRRIIADGFRELGIRLRTSYTTRTVRDGMAYRNGMEAGGRVNLERPVGGAGGAPSLPRRPR